MEKVDYIIAGAGASGLSLAATLQRSVLKNKTILIFDPVMKNQNDRTWCFWSKSLPSSLQDVQLIQWDYLNFHGVGFKKRFSLEPYRYTMVQGIDFYREHIQMIESAANIRLIQAAVQEVTETPQGIIVRSGDDVYAADWFFDSRPPVVNPDPLRYHYLKQHFVGWVVQAEQDVFDPLTPTLFDFRTPQDEAMRFMYILPFSKREALVEYTLFSENLLNEAEYAQGLKTYLQDVLKIEAYEIRHVEQGIIPMSDHPTPRKLGDHHMAIGTRGGLVKPSSGYAFLRIQQDSEKIVQSLIENDHPFFEEKKAARYALFDSIMLQVMKTYPNRMDEIFTVLFQRNTIQAIFNFLDEKNSLLGDIRLISSLPWLPFLKSLVRIKILRRI